MRKEELVMIITDKNTVAKAENLIRHHKISCLEKARSVQEVSARYQQAIQQYQQLMQSQTDNREQRVMLYAEIKTLGWCLGRDEAMIVRQINNQ